jgi:hypothetical protein
MRPTGDAGDGWGRAAAYDAYADGLHTYAIWLLRDHDAAVDALYCTFVLADRHVTQLRQPEHIQPWLYAIMRRECSLRNLPTTALTDSSQPSLQSSVQSPLPSSSPSSSSSLSFLAADGGGSPDPVSGRLRPPGGSADPSGSLASLERNLRRAEFHSLEWPESEGLAPAHREILELTIRHGLDSQGLGLVLGLGQSGRAGRAGRGGDVGGGGAVGGFVNGAIGSVGSQGFGVLADAWRELERSLAAVAVAKASREHCAQLAELTFGWSGRLTAVLRAPLTDHVDGCTRCQHYLHTVIGTSAAPTILPFVAAPRALREILLSELHDPRIALRLGIDHELIAARIQWFAPNGFPAVADPAPLRRRGGRRAAPKGSVAAAKRKSAATERAAARDGAAVTAGAAASQDAVATEVVAREPLGGRSMRGAEGVPGVEGGLGAEVGSGARGGSGAESGPGAESGLGVERGSAELPRRTPGASARRADTRVDGLLDEDADRGGVYRAPGSWAARVMPADTEMVWRPTSADNFISTPSGRFASRAPIAAESARAVNGGDVSGDVNGDVGNGSAGNAGNGARRAMAGGEVGRQSVARGREGGEGQDGGRQGGGPQEAGRRKVGRQEVGRQAGASAVGQAAVRGSAVGESVVREAARRGSVVREATVREAVVREVVRTAVVRRKARPVRRAVLSAVTLGAVGAAAAAAAALLGAASDSHSPRLADIAPPQDPVNTPQPNGGLSVSVSTPAATGTSSGVRGPNGPGVGGQRPTQGGGTSGISGTVTAGSGSGAGSGAGAGLGSGSGAGAGGGGGSSAGGGVSAADFKVSVNQRAADPDSVAILLRNVGSAPIAWSAVAHDPWVTLSQRSGTLGAGQSQTIVASVTSAAPSGAWTSTVTFAPGGAVVTLRGVGGSTSGPSSRPTGAPSTTAPATGGASASSSAQTSSSASPGSTPTSAPTVSSSSSSAASTGGVGPSTAGPSRSGGASASASGSASTSGAASSAASSAASASGSQTASGRRR